MNYYIIITHPTAPRNSRTARLAVADDLAAAKLPADMAAPMDKPTAFKKRAEAMAAAEKMAAAIGIETRAVADLDLPNYLFNQL